MLKVNELDNETKTLYEHAIEAAKYAYSPYSKYKVGAAIITNTGKIYTGCNIENASYSATNCAERTAIFKAVSENQRKFKAIAIYVENKNKKRQPIFPPCGTCRQVIAEFSNDIKIIYGNNEQVVITDIKQLLPETFTIQN